MIIILGGEKGGTGKTTLATNLASIRASHGKNVLLVDTDRQESSNFWALTRDRNNGSEKVHCTTQLGGSVLRLGADSYNTFEDIIIDAGGRNSIELRATMTIADKLYIPIQPSQFDIWTLARMNELVVEAQRVNPKLKAVVVINRASHNPSVTDTYETIRIIKEYDHLIFSGLVIKDRIVYRKAASMGKSVNELNPPDIRAMNEMNTFYQEVFHERA